MIYIALPAMNESASLPSWIRCMQQQTLHGFRAVVCFNQPEAYRSLPGKQSICDDNQKGMELFRELGDARFVLLDHCSPGKGWPKPNEGVGMARKMAMDAISHLAQDSDILVSMDADTWYPPSYLQSIQEQFGLHKRLDAISLPYYHRLSGNEALDRAMLRYEIYMRNYALGMFGIGNPYCFTALGSAMACTLKIYRKIGGMSPKLSGEDFYFLQKIVKSGNLGLWNESWAYPATRLSDRVHFGTGPALIKGLGGDWGSYPIYPSQLFGLVQQTYVLFPRLFTADLPTPLDGWLIERTGTLPWKGLRKNHRNPSNFAKACAEKIDGLRILQFLKEKEATKPSDGLQVLEALFGKMAARFPDIMQPNLPSSFHSGEVAGWDAVRNYLMLAEHRYRQQHTAGNLAGNPPDA